MKDTVLGFVQKASSMKPIGFSFLIITVLMLFSAIDRGFNHIWRTKKRRKAIIAFFMYWLLLIVGPLFLGLSIALSSYFTSLLLITDTGRQIGGQLTIVLPWLLTTIGLTIIYLIIPNSRVRFLHAIIGATVAGFLFEVAKKIFTIYVTSFPLQEIIFGALSVLPLFLIWVYMSWLVILIGAEVCHGLESFNPDRDDSDYQNNHFIDCLIVLDVIDKKVSTVNHLDRENIIEHLSKISDISIAECLTELQRIDLVQEQEDGNLVMLKDLEEYSLHQYTEVVQWKLPGREMILASDISDKQLAIELLSYQQKINEQPIRFLKQLHRQV